MVILRRYCSFGAICIQVLHYYETSLRLRKHLFSQQLEKQLNVHKRLDLYVAKGRYRPERSFLNAIKENHKPQQLEPTSSHAREQVLSLFLQANDEQGIDGEDYHQYLAPDEDSNCEALLAYVDKGPEENVEAANPHATDNDSNDDMGDTEADAMGTHDVHHQMALSDWLDRIQSTALKSSYLT
jgi:hypothetical protein